MAKILVIDDDAAMRKLASIAFRPLSHLVLEAVNGIEGLSIAAKEMPDLIICDYHMPELNGLGTVKMIRKEASLKDVPIIIVSVEMDKRAIAAFRELGVKYYFAKPIDLGLLKDKVQEILEGKQAGSKKNESESKTDKEYKQTNNRPLIVVCEPNDILNGKLLSMLKGNYRCISVADGASCLNAVLAKHPDAVLMEPDVKFLSAYEVVLRVRDIDGFENTRFVAFSSLRNREKVEENAKLFDGIIEKPYTTEKIMKTLNEVMSNCGHKFVRTGRELILKLGCGFLKWAEENREKTKTIIDEAFLEAFELGKSQLSVDMTKTSHDEEFCRSFINEITEKAAAKEICLDITVNNECIYTELAQKANPNLKVAKPEPAML